MNRSKYDGNIISAIEKRVEDGVVFEASGIIDIPSGGGVGEWLFINGSKNAIIEGREIITNGDEMYYQGIGFSTVSSNGTEEVVSKRNPLHSHDPEARFFTSPTVTADGQSGNPVYMPGAAGQGNSSAGQYSLDGLIRVLPPHAEIILRVTNQGSENPATTQMYLLWAELDDPAPFQM